MNKTEIKKATSNKLIVRLVDVYGSTVAKNGANCKGLIKEQELLMAELKSRGLLEDDDIAWLRM